MQQLSLAARPKTLDALVGQTKVVEAIRGHAKEGRIPKAYLFGGPRGTGKTTIARILALAYQCEHQEVFGAPCKECYANKSSFSIHEINSADVTGIDGVRKILQGSEYGVMGSGAYRVYIMDELQRSSEQAQDLLLKYFESTPDTTKFIVCSMEPWKLSPALRSRCVFYELRELEYDDITLLVTRLLKKIKSDKPIDRLVDALAEYHVKAPRLICQAVDKYAAGASPEEAAQVDGATSIDVRALTKALTKGSWVDVSAALKAAEGLDIRAIRGSMLAYLRTVLLESQDFNSRNEAVAKALTAIAGLENASDNIVAAALAAECYRLCALFNKYKL